MLLYRTLDTLPIILCNTTYGDDKNSTTLIKLFYNIISFTYFLSCIARWLYCYYYYTKTVHFFAPIYLCHKNDYF